MSIVDFPAPSKHPHKKLDEIEFASTPDLGKPYIDVNAPLDCRPPTRVEIYETREQMKEAEKRQGHVASPAAKICQEAASLLDGNRAKQHGNKIALHRTMAGLFSAYLGQPIKPSEAAMLECLMKAARTKHGLHNPDDYRDGAAYFGIAMECADVGC